MLRSHRSHELRRGRCAIGDHYYFITTATHERHPWFTHEHAAYVPLKTLCWLDDHERIRLEVTVVMPDHIHFVAQLLDVGLHTVMHSFKSYSANKINHVLQRRGPVWQAAYYERALTDERGLLMAMRYCLDNPVRAGLVEDFRDYPYWYCR
ncbi:MAG TPA: transposase [Acidiferrobacterales bacterium]|jgi:REP element-mobilizing transposase RayT